MKKYRFKTKEEFEADGLWLKGCPKRWNDLLKMNHYLGKDIPEIHNTRIEQGKTFTILDKIAGYAWTFESRDAIENSTIEQIIEKSTKQFTKTKEIMNVTAPIKSKKEGKIEIIENVEKSYKEDFVFMDKTISILDVGFITQKNLVLYGAGGHGKSEITMAYFKEKGIEPYVITMGTGMTTDRLFGGMNIPTFEASGKIEYLVENSFMNHEFVIFEEMFDAPDFILEQLKDILSSKMFRNGSQVFPIQTKFIVCCTNRTRDEFSKNMSLKALMERFPLELNVIWDNYTEIAYNKLLEAKYGEGEVDSIIPFLLQEYSKNGIVISPRVAVIAYDIYLKCGPEALTFIAEFAKKPFLISETLAKFEGMIKFKEMVFDLSSLLEKITNNPGLSADEDKEFAEDVLTLSSKIIELKSIKVNDDLIGEHSRIVKSATDAYSAFKKRSQVSSIMSE